MKYSILISTSLTLFLGLTSVEAAWGFGDSKADKVLLKDIQVLTLHAGRSTTGRRSAPVLQLNCVGGNAAGKFNPQTVQCYNRGWDGQDVQWECKSDMDNAFRFGAIEVLCEGFDYPDDPYILKGSCGLEYTLDYTIEGQERAQRKSHDYYGGSSSSHHHTNTHKYYNNDSKTTYGDWIVLFVIGLIIYAFYRTCIASGDDVGDRQYSGTNDDYPGGHGGGWFNPGGGSGRPNNYGGGGGYNSAPNPNDSCGGARNRNQGGGGGFWTGLFTGGLAGYMFGNNRGYRGYNQGYGYGGYNRGANTWGGGGGWGMGGGGGGGGSSWGSGGGASTSTGTRTASGFGGTRRR